MKVNGTNCTDKKIIANSFKKYFTGVVSRLYEAIRFNVQNLSPTSASSQYHSTHSFKFERVSENDVETKLRNLKTGKASGLDDILVSQGFRAPMISPPPGAKSLGISPSLRAPPFRDLAPPPPPPNDTFQRIFLYLDLATKKVSEIWFGNLFDNGFARVRLRAKVV